MRADDRCSVAFRRSLGSTAALSWWVDVTPYLQTNRVLDRGEVNQPAPGAPRLAAPFWRAQLEVVPAVACRDGTPVHNRGFNSSGEQRVGDPWESFALVANRQLAPVWLLHGMAKGKRLLSWFPEENPKRGTACRGFLVLLLRCWPCEARRDDRGVLIIDLLALSAQLSTMLRPCDHRDCPPRKNDQSLTHLPPVPHCAGSPEPPGERYPIISRSLVRSRS